jgi:predicted nuclease with TOPRIM domain
MSFTRHLADQTISKDHRIAELRNELEERRQEAADREIELTEVRRSLAAETEDLTQKVAELFRTDSALAELIQLLPDNFAMPPHVQASIDKSLGRIAARAAAIQKMRDRAQTRANRRRTLVTQAQLDRMAAAVA